MTAGGRGPMLAPSTTREATTHGHHHHRAATGGRTVTARTALLGFVAGVLSVLVFHQGTVWLLHMAGVLPNGPYSLRPVPTAFNLPQIVNQCFWGGVWGVVIALVLSRVRAGREVVTAVLFAAVALSLTNWVVLPAIRGTPMFAGGVFARMWPAPVIASAFGFGVAQFLGLLRGRRAT